MKTLIIISLIAILAGCSKKPPSCEDAEAKDAVSAIFLEQAGVAVKDFTPKFIEVITQTATEDGEVCTATISYTLSKDAQKTWNDASSKLEKSIKLTSSGFPVTGYLPERARSILWVLQENSMKNISTLLHLSPTSYFVHMRKYMETMVSENHPEHLTFFAYSSATRALFDDTQQAAKNHEKYISSPMIVEIAYVTRNVKRNGNIEAYVQAIPEIRYFEQFQVMNEHTKRAIEILEN